jgi:hypothetical protein
MAAKERMNAVAMDAVFMAILLDLDYVERVLAAEPLESIGAAAFFPRCVALCTATI